MTPNVSDSRQTSVDLDPVLQATIASSLRLGASPSFSGSTEYYQIDISTTIGDRESIMMGMHPPRFSFSSPVNVKPGEYSPNATTSASRPRTSLATYPTYRPSILGNTSPLPSSLGSSTVNCYSIFRRFSDFLKLQQTLIAHYGLDSPIASFMLKKDSLTPTKKLVAQRFSALQEFLNLVVKLPNVATSSWAEVFFDFYWRGASGIQRELKEQSKSDVIINESLAKIKKGIFGWETVFLFLTSTGQIFITFGYYDDSKRCVIPSFNLADVNVNSRPGCIIEFVSNSPTASVMISVKVESHQEQLQWLRSMRELDSIIVTKIRVINSSKGGGRDDDDDELLLGKDSSPALTTSTQRMTATPNGNGVPKGLGLSEEEKALLEERITAAEAKAAAIQAQLVYALADKKELEDKLEAMKTQTADQNSDSNDVKDKDGSDSSNTNSNSNSNSNSAGLALRQEIENMVQKLQDNEKEIHEIRSALENKETAILELQRESESNLAALKEKLRVSTSEIAKKDKDILMLHKSATENNEKFTAEIENLKNSVNRLQDEGKREAALREEAEAVASSKDLRVKEAESKVSELEAQLRSSQLTISDLSTAKSTLEASHETTMTQIAELGLVLAEQKSEINKLQEGEALSKVRLEEALSEQSKLKAEVATANANIVLQSSELALVKAELTNTQYSLSKTEKLLKETETKLALEGDTVSSLHEKVTLLENSLGKTSAELKKTEKLLNEADTSHKDISTKLSTKEGEALELQGKVTNLENTLQEKVKREEELQTQVSQLQSQLGEAHNLLRVAEEKLRELKALKFELESELDHLNNSNSFLSRKIESVRAPPVKVGALKKQAAVMKNWKKRHFVLERGMLSYYEQPLDVPPFGKDLRGSVNLHSWFVEDLGATGLRWRVYKKKGMGKTTGSTDFIVEADGDDEKQAWILALEAHIKFANTHGSEEESETKLV